MHLRDIDVEGYSERVPLILEQEVPVLPNVNGGKPVRERNYNAPADCAVARWPAAFTRSQRSAVGEMLAGGS
jgi:hypothetical protein